MATDIIKALPLTIYDSSLLGASYLSMNSPGFDHPVVQMFITNESSQDIIVSYDGIIDNEIVVNGGILPLFGGQLISLPNNRVAQFAKYTQIYARVTAPAVGFIYISAYYL